MVVAAILPHLTRSSAIFLSRKDQLQKRFQQLDADGSDGLDPDELCAALVEECAMEEFQARSLIEDFDMNNNGCIGMEEFMALWTSLFGKHHLESVTWHHCQSRPCATSLLLPSM